MPEPSEDAIRAKAYELWLAEGQSHGNHDDHWHKARQLLIELDAKPKAKAGKAKVEKVAKPAEKVVEPAPKKKAAAKEEPVVVAPPPPAPAATEIAAPVAAKKPAAKKPAAPKAAKATKPAPTA